MATLYAGAASSSSNQTSAAAKFATVLRDGVGQMPHAVCPGERWGAWPSPVGLTLGILTALAFQLLAIAYHYYRFYHCKDTAVRVQPEERNYSFLEGVATHLGKPGGIMMIVGYLVGTCEPSAAPAASALAATTRAASTLSRARVLRPLSLSLSLSLSRPAPRLVYLFFSAEAGGLLFRVLPIRAGMFDLMPCSYYSFSGGVRPLMVFAQICSQDFMMYLMHRMEHKASAFFYKYSHKPHHRFTNPRLFDAFDGSMPDTATMILVPLAVTARLLPANVWEYMAFGGSWSAWLVLIHSETAHPWDRAFRALGLGTAADHHVHHKLFKFNYGHTMMWWDWIAGTYKAPEKVGVFNKGV